MKPSNTFNHAAKGILSLTLLFVCPLFLPAQSKDKKSDPTPPPPPQQQQPQRQQPPPQQQQQQRPVQQQQQRPVPQPQHAGPRGTVPATVKPGTGPTTVKPGTGPATAKPGTAPTTVKSGTGAATVKPEGNAKPTTVNLPNGGKSVTTPQGHKLEFNKSGQLSNVVTNKGAEAHFDARGKVRTITTAHGTTITHGPGGERHIVTEHRDANNRVESRVVTTGANRGFVERRFERGGQEYMRRTYVYEGRTNVTVYRTYYYGGVPYYHYVPAYYYAPGYYGWAYNPWPAPVYYTWGWYGAQWYAPYGYYFAPYPVYPSAAFWLTDYVIAENLQADYEAQAGAHADAMAANADAAAANADAMAAQPGSQAGAATLTPEVKQMIAEEVKAQLAAEQAAAAQDGTASVATTSSPSQPVGNSEQVPPALDPNLHVFIVTTTLNVTAGGQPCFLSPGDVLVRTEDTPKKNTVAVIVFGRQKSDCLIGSSPRIQVADLQEMHNHFREQLDNGLKTLADNQGKKGIPSAPAAGGRKNPDSAVVPDLTATIDLQKQKQDADQIEKDVQQAASPTAGSGVNN
jgi:hypothetical protein